MQYAGPYNDPSPNPMSQNTRVLSYDPRLLLLTILRAKDGDFVVSFGLVCSTFVTISRHSTKRSYFNPLGDCSKKSVADANLLCSRQGCLCTHASITYCQDCHSAYNDFMISWEDVPGNLFDPGEIWNMGVGTAIQLHCLQASPYAANITTNEGALASFVNKMR